MLQSCRKHILGADGWTNGRTNKQTVKGKGRLLELLSQQKIISRKAIHVFDIVRLRLVSRPPLGGSKQKVPWIKKIYWAKGVCNAHVTFKKWFLFFIITWFLSPKGGKQKKLLSDSRNFFVDVFCSAGIRKQVSDFLNKKRILLLYYNRGNLMNLPSPVGYQEPCPSHYKLENENHFSIVTRALQTLFAI